MTEDVSGKTVKKGTWPQWIAGFTVALITTQVGFMTGWSSPYIGKLTSEGSSFTITMTEVSWVVSLLNLGRLVGAVVGSLAVNYLGSKTSCFLINVPIVLSWLFVIIANNVWWLYAARFLGGLVLGMMYSSLSLYLGEIADPAIRGGVVAMGMSGNAIGTFLMSVMGAYLPMGTSASVCLAPWLLCTILFLWLPESPHYHIKKKADQKARSAIQFYQRDCDVEQEFQNLKKFIDSTSGQPVLGTLKEFTKPTYRKSLLLVLMLFVYNQMCGVNNVLFYMETILRSAKVTTVDPAQVVIIVMSTGIVSSLVSLFLMDRFGRKVLMICSVTGIVISLCSLTLVYHLLSYGVSPLELEGFAIFAMVLFYVTVYFGIYSVPSAILGELFPSHMKCVAACLGSMVAGIASFISTQTYLPLLGLFTQWYVYLFYSALLFTAIPFVIYCVPETKGLSLQEIQQKLMK